MIMLQLFLSFLKIGLFTIGGGYAMLPLIRETVLEHGWMDTETMLDLIAVSESTPGPMAVNAATFTGARTAGLPGAVFATLGVILPSFVIILVVAVFYEKYKKSRVVTGMMSGLRPAVIGLIASALLSVALAVFLPAGVSRENVLSASFAVSAVVCVAALVLAFRKVHPILIIGICAAAGIAAGYLLDL